MSRASRAFARLPLLVLTGVIVLGPLGLLLRLSLYAPARGIGFYEPNTLTLENLRALLAPSEVRIAGVTLLFGLALGALTPLTAYPLALFVRSLSPKVQPRALAGVLFPKTAGLLAAMFSLQRWLPRGTAAAVAGELLLIVPYAVLVLWVQLQALDPAWDEAARGLGATPRQRFLRVTLPLSTPGLLLAFQLGLMWGLGAFLGPMFLGTPQETTLSVELHRQAFEYGRWPRAAALALELLGLLAATFWLGAWAENHRGRRQPS